MKFICFLKLTFPKTVPKANDRLPFRLEQSASFQRRWLLVVGREAICICSISSTKSHQPPTPNSSFFGINHRPFHLPLPNLTLKFGLPKFCPTIIFPQNSPPPKCQQTSFSPKKTSPHKRFFQPCFKKKKIPTFFRRTLMWQRYNCLGLGFRPFFFHTKISLRRKTWVKPYPIRFRNPTPSPESLKF